MENRKFREICTKLGGEWDDDKNVCRIPKEENLRSIARTCMEEALRGGAFGLLTNPKAAAISAALEFTKCLFSKKFIEPKIKPKREIDIESLFRNLRIEEGEKYFASSASRRNIEVIDFHTHKEDFGRFMTPKINERNWKSQFIDVAINDELKRRNEFYYPIKCAEDFLGEEGVISVKELADQVFDSDDFFNWEEVEKKENHTNRSYQCPHCGKIMFKCGDVYKCRCGTIFKPPVDFTNNF